MCIINEYEELKMVEAAQGLAMGVAAHYDGVLVATKDNLLVLTFPNVNNKQNYISKCADAFKHMNVHEISSLKGLSVAVRIRL